MHVSSLVPSLQGAADSGRLCSNISCLFGKGPEGEICSACPSSSANSRMLEGKVSILLDGGPVVLGIESQARSLGAVAVQISRALGTLP